MNRPGDTTAGSLGGDRDPPAPLDGLVGALLGRQVRDLRVQVLPGGLILHGRAASYHAKQLAQHAAMAVTDLPLIANRIEVTSPRHESPWAGGTAFGARAARPPKGRVLLATDDDELRSAGDDYLTAHGFIVATARDGLECVALLREFAADVVVLDADLHWGGADGVLEHLRTWDGPCVPTVLLTSPFASPPGSGSGGPPVVLVLEKPVLVGTVLWAVRSALGEDSIAHPGV
jgi:CheY-like chemotaxis protein